MVAVVVPSPASLEAFWATSLDHLGCPCFRRRRRARISLATVTPSLVTVEGARRIFQGQRRTAGRAEGDLDGVGELLDAHSGGCSSRASLL